jgi:hypothetical protein
MFVHEFKPNVMVWGPLLPEPVQVIVVVSRAPEKEKLESVL